MDLINSFENHVTLEQNNNKTPATGAAKTKKSYGQKKVNDTTSTFNKTTIFSQEKNL